MVGSEESEYSGGWDYDNWVDDLYNNVSTENLLHEICQTFVDSYGGVNKTSFDDNQCLAKEKRCESVEKPFIEEDGTCVEKCSSQKSRGFQCVDSCPKNAHYFYQYKNFIFYKQSL